ncbi:ubiquitin fusion degradation protein 1 homolog isoform X2 [Capsicum annuum]|uniref:ubiquitin fusion degradation protein 1 homolog isoform X2 n=1 Tax=Capsicum annuum TaxID=4072 RepID=UPI001FB16664|nr:ubiquitin fusion degradation protein 1 homolog isoform X2 [Capsicum annuum]
MLLPTIHQDEVTKDIMFFDGYGYHGRSFEQTYRFYPASFIEKPQIENGDKIIMPPSALDRLEEGMIYMPYWMMENLFLQVGDIVTVKNVALPKGKYVRLQPHTKDFLDISNPKAMFLCTIS